MEQVPLRGGTHNRFFGDDLSIVDGVFPGELKNKLRLPEVSYDESEYWHLVRLAKRTDMFRAYMPLAWVVIAVLWGFSIVVLNIGYIQTLVFLALTYWTVGLWLKAGSVRKVVVPIVVELQAVRERHPPDDTSQEQ
ncbi:MAG: hypothetical protein ACP5PJ_10550 [Acidimicrobiales bacterium]